MEISSGFCVITEICFAHRMLTQDYYAQIIGLTFDGSIRIGGS